MGRFSNGPNYVDLLSDHLGVDRPRASELGGTNYAYGGGTSGAIDNRFGVKDVDDQVASYLETNTPSGNELFVVSASSVNNDFFTGQTDPVLAWTFVENTVSQLLAAGGRNLLITNVRRVRPSDADFAARYNEESASGVEALRITHPTAKIFELDVSRVFQDIANEPATYGITDIDSQVCLDCGVGLNPAPMQIQENANEFLFWDDGHPSATAHEALADAAIDAVRDPDESLTFEWSFTTDANSIGPPSGAGHVIKGTVSGLFEGDNVGHDVNVTVTETPDGDGVGAEWHFVGDPDRIGFSIVDGEVSSAQASFVRTDRSWLLAIGMDPDNGQALRNGGFFATKSWNSDVITEFIAIAPCSPTNSLLGDLDGDGTVGFPDFLQIADNFGDDAREYEAGDVNCDGTVAFDDFLAIAGNFGETLAAESEPEFRIVPEPSAGILGVSALLLITLRYRRSSSCP